MFQFSAINEVIGLSQSKNNAEGNSDQWKIPVSARTFSSKDNFWMGG